ncbi:Probable flavin-containing monoamine oxidase A [Eumeta japonica]|uniref:monoamine oxidase n=1 Tax=Eumeta variegata TaxID=151549 RepID=A0A4C1S9W5_EUMVA|nr:Probable flavin-containing monoamine oxidase A [Eumeta japonica]
MIKSLSVDETDTNNIEADVIVLGRSLPGVVVAHRLRQKFGDTMDIKLLDLSGVVDNYSSRNVTFQVPLGEDDRQRESLDAADVYIGNVAHRYIMHYMTEFNIPIPETLFRTEVSDPPQKMYQYRDGRVVTSPNDYHEFSFLNFFQRLELNNYQSSLDRRMSELFRGRREDDADSRTLRYYDRTSMESDLVSFLLLSESRDVMRLVVRTVCGASAHSVSLLFYLHQCYRNGGSRNYVGGANTSLREKLLGYCRKRLTRKLQQSVEDITFLVKPIKTIRTYSDEQVIVETTKGDYNYVCNQLAMAVRPEELSKISFEERLLSNLWEAVESARGLRPRQTKKFQVKYAEKFWRQRGFSGEILSVRGPILWAIEKPVYSTTGSLEKYSTLVGFLEADDEDEANSREAVLAQLVELFGAQAASPTEYRETEVEGFVPRCEDYVALRSLARTSSALVVWGALDLFADGDLAAALEAGHSAYVRLVLSMRPQAQDFDDLSAMQWRRVLPDTSFVTWFNTLSYNDGFRYVMYCGALYLGYRVFRKYIIRS